MFDTATEIEQTLIKMNEVASVAATVVPVHGKKKKFKQFWNLYNKLQDAVAEHFKFLETYSEPDYQLPFQSESFSKAWKEWQIYILEETGKHIGKIRSKKQAMLIGEFYDNEADAKKALNYFINKGYTFIFKLDKKDGTKEKHNETGKIETDWDAIEE